MTVGAEIKKQNKFAKILSGFWDEFIYGSHLSSLGLLSVVLANTIIIGKEVSVVLLIISYIIVNLVYTIDHIKGLGVDQVSNPERVGYLLKTHSKIIYKISAFVITLVILLLFFSNTQTVILIMAIFMFGYFYPKKFTKKIVGFKNYYVSFLWAVSAIALPYVYYSRSLDALFFSIFIFIFIRELLNTTYFDFKDIESDKAEGLKTIPVMIGAKKTISLLNFYNILSILFLIGAIVLGFLKLYMILLALLFVYSCYYISVASSKNSAKIRKVLYIMVDGEYLLWPPLLLIGGLIFK